MLKILINNEEVVCDKQLEIKEEMLSTSSCILNNCYPKSWENTKDYTSQYYYPKDYSKCVIKDEVNVPAEEGEYATGTDLNINVDNTKEWSYQLQGDTQQEGTPTPSNPQNINVVTGEQNVIISHNEENQNYPVNLGKNLFDKDNANYVNGWIDGTTMRLNTINGNRMFYIPCKPNTTYTISRSAITSSFRTTTYDSTPFPTVTSSNVNYTVPTVIQNNSGTTLTITTNANAKYLVVHYGKIEDTNLNETLATMQVERGNVATSYVPYITPIELCKIGDYQDYIYNQNGDWYLHKEIGKVILNGSSNEIYTYQNNNRFWLRRSYWTNETVPFNPPQNALQGLYCNRFTEKTRGQTWDGIEGISYDNPNTVDQPIGSTFDIACNSVATNETTFKTWLSSNNLIVYYILQNQQDIQITDTTLIQQLDNLKNATLFNGVNNISVDGNLPSILNLHYNFVTARTDITLLFCGVVKNTGNINLNPRYPHYCNLEVLDFKTFLSECDQLDFVINNKTITEAIEQVTQAVASYGFVVGNININDNTIIGAYSTQEKTPYDVFQYLADISQSRWYTRLIDENTVAIDFYDPVEMQRGADLDFFDNTFACENNIEDLSFNYGTYDYRNKQIMLSDQVYGGVDFDETVVSNGYNNSFSTSTPIGILKEITINGVNATFATNEDKMIGIEADFYYTIGETLIEGEIYPTGTVINIIYTPLIKGREIINNTNEINRISSQIGRKGIISRYEKRNDILSSNALNLIGTSYLKYKGTPEINLMVKTKDIDLYNIGQIVYFNYPNIQELSQDYMVKSKKTKIINTSSDWNIWYTYILSSNFNSENAINYFDNQRAKASGNIQKGDYITRNIDIEQNCMVIFSNPSAEEITVLGDNILNSPLNSPFIK